MTIYVDNLTLYGLPRQLMDSTVFGVNTRFGVTNMAQLHRLLGIQIVSISPLSVARE
jgi:hypothetical protein